MGDPTEIEGGGEWGRDIPDSRTVWLSVNKCLNLNEFTQEIGASSQPLNSFMKNEHECQWPYRVGHNELTFTDFTSGFHESLDLKL
jgi:hypothetical protein